MVKSIVQKQAIPPITLEIGSARKTPMTPRPPMCGRSIVNGTTMTTFLNIEKKIAFFAFPSEVNAHCPENCRAIMKKPKK